VSTVAACRGANGKNGAATFTGGTTPTTWAGYALTTSSLGHLAASDGTDMGAQTFGSGGTTPTPTPPPPPPQPPTPPPPPPPPGCVVSSTAWANNPITSQ